MICPHCQSTSITRAAKEIPKLYRTPRSIKGTIYRVHRCLDCSRLFLSEQMAVSRTRSEEMEERMLPPIVSSDPTPNDSDSP